MWYYIFDWFGDSNVKPTHIAQKIKINFHPNREEWKELWFVYLDNPIDLFKIDTSIQAIQVKPPNKLFPFYSIYTSKFGGFGQR